jgi:hypothetical protein
MVISAPFPYTITPMNNISVPTYRDGMTYTLALEQLKNYVTTVLVKDINDVFADVAAQYQAGIENAEQAVTDAKTGWDARYDAFIANFTNEIKVLNESAVAGMVPAGAVHDALIALIDAEIAAATADLHAYADGKDTELAATLRDETTAAVAGVQAGTDAVTADVATLKPGLDYGYLVTAFTGNGTGEEKLSVFYSPDGKTVLGTGGKHVYTDTHTGTSLRDPSTLKVGSFWYTAYTIDNGQQRTFGVLRSGNLTTWTPVTTVDVSAVPNLSRAWAPELIQDSNGDVYAFFSRIDTNNVGAAWYVRATSGDLSTWSAPSGLAWTAPPANIIDPTFVKNGSTWYCFYKNEGTKYLERATATTLTGPYTIDRTGNWAGWGSGLEGAEIVKAGPGLWRLYADRYDPGLGYQWAESADLNTWSAMTSIATAPNVLDAGQSIRHGSFQKIGSAADAATVIGTALGTAYRHAEFSAVGTGVPANTVTGPGSITRFTLSDHTRDGGFVTSPAPGQLQFLVDGVYSVGWVGDHAGTAAGAGSFMAIKSTDQTAVYATTDIPSNSGAQSVSFPPKYFRAGSIIQFFCQFGTPLPTLNSHITVHKE